MNNEKIKFILQKSWIYGYLNLVVLKKSELTPRDLKWK